MGSVNCRLSSFHNARQQKPEQGSSTPNRQLDHAKNLSGGRSLWQNIKASRSKNPSQKSLPRFNRRRSQLAEASEKGMAQQDPPLQFMNEFILISDDEDNNSIDSNSWQSLVEDSTDQSAPHQVKNSDRNIDRDRLLNSEVLIQGDGRFEPNSGDDAPRMSQNISRGSSQHSAPGVEDMEKTMGLNLTETTGSDRSRIDRVVAIFPGICEEYVSELYGNGVAQEAETLIAYILDQLEKNIQYPKASDKLKTLKRKRELDEDEEEAQEYGKEDRALCGSAYGIITRDILSSEFSTTPMHFIDRILAGKRFHLYPTYQALEEAERNWNIQQPPYNKLKQSRKAKQSLLPDVIETALKDPATPPDKMLALRELQAARKARKKAEDKIRAENQAALDEEENLRKAQKEGQMAECGCCFSDHPLNRMVHCDNEDILHWFCRSCAKKMAESEVGNSKYELRCMSMDGCEAVFRWDQISQFLDATTLIALERNEQEAMLRMAGIENLASCPFCPFAAEYPPIEQDRLFRCQAPDCEKVSCRLCNLESHVPKSCEENRKENGLSIRREIEEAMSAALIRKCNKCGTPFVKEEGCNKMTCTRSGCHNIQCYVCSKSCSYDHFDDRTRGGKAGNCPLFENVHERHEQEVKRAEKIALDKVRAEHPEYTEDDLKIKLSEDVKRDEQRRRAQDPRLPPFGILGPNIYRVIGAPYGPIPPPPPPGLGAQPMIPIPAPQFLPANAVQPQIPARPVYFPGEEVHDQFGVREDDLAGLFGPLAEAEFPHMRRDPMHLRQPFRPQAIRQDFPGFPPIGWVQQAPRNENQAPAVVGNAAVLGNAQRYIDAMRAQFDQLHPAIPVAGVQQQAHRRRR